MLFASSSLETQVKMLLDCYSSMPYHYAMPKDPWDLTKWARDREDMSRLNFSEVVYATELTFQNTLGCQTELNVLVNYTVV